MKGDCLSVKVTLTGWAKYVRVYDRDFFNAGGQQGSALY